MKKAYIIYRGSGNNQMEETCITVQKTACRDFAKLQGWEVIKEFHEPIVPVVTAATEPGALQIIKDDALSGLYDILLVYKYELLGRKELETPFAVEWLAKHGVDTWSVLEGAKRFTEEVDRLVYWAKALSLNI